jgi:hypothetical protein
MRPSVNFTCALVRGWAGTTNAWSVLVFGVSDMLSDSSSS